MIAETSEAGIVPTFVSASGAELWLKTWLRPARPFLTFRPRSADSCSSVIGRCVPSATR